MSRLGKNDPLELEIFSTLLKLADCNDQAEKQPLLARLARLQAAKQQALADLAAESICENQLADDSLMDGGRYARSEWDMVQLVKRKGLGQNMVKPEDA